MGKLSSSDVTLLLESDKEASLSTHTFLSYTAIIHNSRYH